MSERNRLILGLHVFTSAAKVLQMSQRFAYKAWVSLSNCLEQVAHIVWQAIVAHIVSHTMA